MGKVTLENEISGSTTAFISSGLIQGNVTEHKYKRVCIKLCKGIKGPYLLPPIITGVYQLSTEECFSTELMKNK